MQLPRYAFSRRVTLLAGVLLTLAWLAVYALTASPTVNFIDSGELITALHEPGVVHPPGYPLYTLLGYVASQVPLGEVAHRVNLFSTLWGAVTVGMMFWLLVTCSGYTGWLLDRRAAPVKPHRKASRSQARAVEPERSIPTTYGATTVLSALAGACLLGAASTFWNRSIQAKMYTLHYFFVLLLLWLAVSYRWSYERGDKRTGYRYLVALAVTLGVSFTNHLMTSLLVPGLALLLILGSGWSRRLSAIIRRWAVLLPAFLAPLLLYLYLPVRSSQAPTMDWGAPNTPGDFWRHISGWQYTAYLNRSAEDLANSAQRIKEYASQQWDWLTLVILILCFASAILLTRANLPLFLATLTTGVITLLFAVQYGISEIEPYLVPLYEMLIIWLGLAPQLFDRFMAAGQGIERGQAQVSGSARDFGLPASALLLVVALMGAALQFPRQNHSNDRLAELFAMNILNGLEKDSIIITDHWDFQSPSYYMQLVQNARPDVVIVGKSSLRYPWYLGQLERRYPWLIANSRDIANVFSSEQRKWINGENPNLEVLDNSYYALLTSFVERNIDKHPAYVFFSWQCNPADPGLAQSREEGNKVAPNYARQLTGIAFRLWPQGAPANSPPPDPNFDLRGYTSDKTPLDEFARVNAGCYATTYGLAAQANAGAGNNQKAQELANKASELQKILAGGH